MMELLPYDLMIIATHCGDVDGFRWTYEFTDSEGIDRTLVVDIAVGVGRTNDANMLRVTQFIRFISLDGVDWHDPKKKGTLYVGKAILDYLEMTGSSTAPMKPTKKETVPRVVGSSALTRGRPHRAMPERFKVPNVSIHRWSGQSVPSLSELRRDTLSSPRVIGGFTAASAFSRETAAGAKLPLSDKVTPKREDTGFCRPKRKAVVRFNEQDHARHEFPQRRIASKKTLLPEAESRYFATSRRFLSINDRQETQHGDVRLIERDVRRHVRSSGHKRS